jgi:hypothetical protein
MQRFLDWMAGHPYGLATASPAAAEVCRMKESLHLPTLQTA